MIVWAYKPLEVLGGKVGFQNIPDRELAMKLLKSGDVQNPQMGAAKLNPIQRGEPQKEKIVRRRKKKVEKVIEPESVQTDELSNED